jgi:hypothetical protein
MGSVFSRDENTDLYALESKMAKKYTHTDSSMKFMSDKPCGSETPVKSLEHINGDAGVTRQQN